MSVRKRGNKWMVDIVYQFPDGNTERIRKVSPVQTRRGAEQYEREVRLSLLEGTFANSGKEEEEVIPTFKEFSELFINSYAIPNNKPSEVKTKRAHLKRYLLPVFGSKPLSRIRLRDIEAFKGRLLKASLKAKTINNVLTTLNRMLRYAVELEILETVPDVRKLKTERPDFDYLQPQEAEKLLEAATYNPEWHAMIYVALKTGLRYGELSELRWKDLDLPNGLMHVKRSYYDGNITSPKSGKPRLIPLSTATIKLLRGIRHLKSELVFCKPDGGRHIHRRADVALKRCCAKAGLRPIGWHVLRHTFASHLVGKGIHLRTIQELLGHASIAMTERYAHTSTELIRGAVEALDEPISCIATAQ